MSMNKYGPDSHDLKSGLNIQGQITEGVPVV